MKFLSAFFSFTLAAHAASSDPGKAAIDFLEKLREGKLNLEPGGDTALAPQTADWKRRQIAKRIERIAHDLGNDPLELGAVKLDENLAAVIVRKLGGVDSSRLQIFPVALVKRGEIWEPAPIPASFENAGASYAIALRKRVEQLEDWMLREQVRDLANLREESDTRLRTKIEATFSAKELGSYDVKQICDRFLTACAKGDLPTLLGIVGGLQTPLPKDWSHRLKAVENAVGAGSAASRPWRLLMSPDVARVVLRHEEDGDTGLVSIGCLDPIGNAREKPVIEALQFELTKSSGLWRLELPDPFLRASSSDSRKRKHDPAQIDPDKPQESGVVGEFPEIWTAAHPPAPQPGAEFAAKNWLASLNEGDFPSLLAIMKTSGDPISAAQAFTRAAETWSDIRSGAGANVAVPLAFKDWESQAVGIYQFFTARDPDKQDLRPAYFEKTPDGWLWTPTPSSSTRDTSKEWVEGEIKRLSDRWQQDLLSGCPVLGNVGALESPTEAEVRECVGDWLAAVGQGDFRTALSHIVRLGGDRSATATLQNLGYEITAMRGCQPPPSISTIYQEKPLAAASVKIERDEVKTISPLYTVIKTPQGPRILIEIDLIASDNRNRDFLNNTALIRLGKATTPEVESALRKILVKHQASDEAPIRKIDR